VAPAVLFVGITLIAADIPKSFLDDEFEGLVNRLHRLAVAN
jgi:hypothetical protein